MEESLDARVIDDYLVKKPFVRVAPAHFSGDQIGIYSKASEYMPVQDDSLIGEMKTQAEFLREYHVSGHKINSEDYYPNIWKKSEDGRSVVELVSRVAFPFQQVIATKQLIHLTGNPIKLEDSTHRPSARGKEVLSIFKQGWKDKNLDIAFFEFANSIDVTGDSAICFFYHKGQIRWKVLSYLEGDTLFVHKDQMTGETKLFVRKYSMYDEKNREISEYVEAWDSRYMYRFKKQKVGVRGIINNALTSIGKSGWEMVGAPSLHGFNRIPVSYHREDDVCWAASQSNIEAYEMAVSQLCENNKAYAFPILFVKGGDLNFKGRVDGRPYAIVSSSPEADAKTVGRTDASQSFKLQLDILLQNIFMGSFAVLPPEIRSGDMPGVSIKLYYSPAVEKAMRDARKLDHVIDDMVQIFKEGFGVEKKMSSEFKDLNVHGYIEPYVHQNVAEVMQNLFNGVTAGYLSKETAAEVTPYSKNDEYKRILQQVRNEITGIQNQEDDEIESTGA